MPHASTCGILYKQAIASLTIYFSIFSAIYHPQMNTIENILHSGSPINSQMKKQYKSVCESLPGLLFYIAFLLSFSPSSLLAQQSGDSLHLIFIFFIEI